MSKDSTFYEIGKKINWWLPVIDNFSAPKDDLQRSYLHYKCMRPFEDKRRELFRTIVSLLLFPASFIAATISKILRGNKENRNIVVIGAEKYLNIHDLESILPSVILEEKNIKLVKNSSNRTRILSGCVSIEIIKILAKSILRYPWSILFNYSLFLHLCTINRYIIQYNPRIIVTLAAENDFTSSCISHYCENNNCSYVCVMHGEYFLTPYHAFVRFSEFYVWDEHYASQFSRLRCPPDMFRIYEPKRFAMEKYDSVKNHDITYYLQDFTEKQLKSILLTLIKLSNLGYVCKVRPHKRASNMAAVNKIFGNRNLIGIESTDIPISISLQSCKYVVSVYSTVISEAYYNGLPALIDDVSDPQLYEMLDDVMYINLKRIKGRVSDLFI